MAIPDDIIVDIPWIPDDIIVKILLRQPVKSLVRFKCVSKPWRSLITDHKFVSNHVNHVARADNRESYHHVILTDMALSPSSPIKFINFDAFALSDDGDGEIVVKRLKLPEEFGLPTDQYKVLGNCDGLLLLCDQEINLLWNPSIGDYKILPKPAHAHGPAAYGLGYDHSSNVYKVVQINLQTTGLKSNHVDVKVYNMKTKSWTTYELRMGLAPTPNIPAIHVNGNLYWQHRLVHTRGVHRGVHCTVLCFSLVEERFKNVPRLGVGLSDATQARLGVLGGCLCMPRFSEGDGTIELWVLKETETWTKFTTITQASRWLVPTNPNCILTPLCLTNKRQLLVVHFGKLFILYHNNSIFKTPTSKTLMASVISYGGDASNYQFATVYAETLVSPN